MGENGTILVNSHSNAGSLSGDSGRAIEKFTPWGVRHFAARATRTLSVDRRQNEPTQLRHGHARRLIPTRLCSAYVVVNLSLPSLSKFDAKHAVRFNKNQSWDKLAIFLINWN